MTTDEAFRTLRNVIGLAAPELSQQEYEAAHAALEVLEAEVERLKDMKIQPDSHMQATEEVERLRAQVAKNDEFQMAALKENARLRETIRTHLHTIEAHECKFVEGP